MTMPARWFLITGSTRPTLEGQDSALVLLEAVNAHGTPPSCVLAPEGDRLHRVLADAPIEAIPLPTWLTTSRRRIVEALTLEANQASFRQLCQRIADKDPGWGLSFYSAWLPEQLFQLPKNGLLNFHPGDLPSLRGIEPETWAILLGMSAIHGSVHQVTSEFDAGDVYWTTSAVPISDWETPRHLLAGLTQRFIDEIPAFLSAYLAGRLVPWAQQIGPNCEFASLQRLRPLALLDWRSLSHRELDRRLRAFGGQHVPVFLTAHCGAGPEKIADLELWEGDFPGNPGDLLGCYTDPGNPRDGCRAIRTTEGVALVERAKPDNHVLISHGYRSRLARIDPANPMGRITPAAHLCDPLRFRVVPNA